MFHEMDYDYLFKIVLIGDMSVGKTNVLLKFTNNSYNNSYIATIGVDYKMHLYKHNEKYIKFQLWDTAGQERFRTITNKYYRGAHAILIFFDITNYKSFDNVNMWLKEIDEHCLNKVEKILIGTKTDLSNYRAVSINEIQDFAKKINILYFETSAKTGENIDIVFHELSDLLIHETANIIDNGESNILLSNKKNCKSKCCNK